MKLIGKSSNIKIKALVFKRKELILKRSTLKTIAL